MDSLSRLQIKLENENIANMGRISLYNYFELPENIWGKFRKPVSLKISYYHDIYKEEESSVIIPTKNENLDTYAIRIKDTIDSVLYKTNSTKVTIIAHSMGGLVKLHICGDITHLLPGIATLGIDIIDIDHMVDMAETRRILGGDVTLTGNIDPAGGVLYGKPDRIRETMRETYRTVGNPYLVNAGCEIPSGTPNENLKALCEPIHYD